MKRWRVLQTGDLHVGRGRATWGEAITLERSSLLFDTLYRVAREQNCHAILVTGDIFDTKMVTNAERELVARKLAKYAGRDGLPWYFIPGNHDLTTHKTGNLDYLAEIAASGELPNLKVAFSHTVEIWQTGLPGLSVIGAPVGFSEDQVWLDEFVRTLPKDQQYVFMGHGSIRGCVRNDAGWKPTAQEDSKRLSLARAATAAPQIVWWAYGDIHKRQSLPTLPSGANGWYAGSPIQMDFGEQPDRGVLIVALDRKDSGWEYKGRRYVRLDTDDSGFAPLLTVTKQEDIDKLPKNALIRIAKNVVIPSDKHEQIMKTLKVVDDRSLQVATTVVGASGLEVFDPLLSDLATVEREVLADLQPREAKTEVEAKRIVGLAVERYRERTYVS